MDTAFTNRQRETLAAAVDTFVPSVSRDDDPTGFFATKGSDVGAHLAVEDYLLTKLSPEQLAGLKQLLDTAAIIGLKNQPQSIREAIIGNLGRISPEKPWHGSRTQTAVRHVLLRAARRRGPQPILARNGIPRPRAGAATNPEDPHDRHAGVMHQVKMPAKSDPCIT